jgi:hypothetical protein
VPIKAPTSPEAAKAVVPARGTAILASAHVIAMITKLNPRGIFCARGTGRASEQVRLQVRVCGAPVK